MHFAKQIIFKKFENLLKGEMKTKFKLIVVLFVLLVITGCSPG